MGTMAEVTQGQAFDFDNVDADAVCERCGTVNPEGTLICKACGQNLRDQRLRRLSQAQIVAPGAERISRLRLLTGLLSAFGILLVLLVVLNLGSIENGLVRMQSDTNTGSLEFWTGDGASVYDQLQSDLDQNPSSQAQRRHAMDDPVDDETFNGRYVLVRPEGLQGINQIIGEANLLRKDDRVYFVATLPRDGVEIRGVARLIQTEDGAIRPQAMDSASIRVNGEKFEALGYAVKNDDGGHVVYAQTTYTDQNLGAFAYRIR